MIVLASMLNNTEALTMGAVVGGIIVIVLILAFVLGARHQLRDSEPDRPLPRAVERDSWSTPASTPGQAPRGDPAAPEHVAYIRP